MSLKKATNNLLRIFWDKFQKLPSCWYSKHRDWETLTATQCWICEGSNLGGRDLCGEKKLEIRLMR